MAPGLPGQLAERASRRVVHWVSRLIDVISISWYKCSGMLGRSQMSIIDPTLRPVSLSRISQ